MKEPSPDSTGPGSSAVERPDHREAGGAAPPRGSSTFHYVIVRRELSGGALIAQAVHAAGESASHFTQRTGLPLPDTTRAVILVASKDELARLKFDLEAIDEDFTAIVETDGPLAGSTTALGLVTQDRETLKAGVPVLAQLRPWRAA